MTLPVIAAFLVFARIAALLMVMPVLSSAAVPSWVRLALAVPLTAVILPAAGAYGGAVTPSAMIVGVLREIALGVTMGFATQLVASVLSITFEAVATQAGLAVASQIDPMTASNASTLSSLGGWLATGAFFAADVHLACIRAIARSYGGAPIGDAYVGEGALREIVTLAEVCFETGIQLAGPLTVFLFAVHLGQALLGRMAPNVQLFWAIGPILTVGFGLVVLAASLPSILTGWFGMLPTVLSLLDVLPTAR
ncbi:MAG: hypothetical protein RLZZ299_2674 [Pseudomonadota bacterium]|jgi:flagellar biosynthetic protein FliR